MINAQILLTVKTVTKALVWMFSDYLAIQICLKFRTEFTIQHWRVMKVHRNIIPALRTSYRGKLAARDPWFSVVHRLISEKILFTPYETVACPWDCIHVKVRNQFLVVGCSFWPTSSDQGWDAGSGNLFNGNWIPPPYCMIFLYLSMIFYIFVGSYGKMQKQKI